jgi:hypothetical protein
MKQPIHDEAGNSKALEDDRRHCRRVLLSFPIKVSGFDLNGQPFSDLSVTTDVSDQGCRFDLLRQVQLGDVLTIQLVDRSSGKPSDERAPQFRVAWVWPSERGWSVGVTLVHEQNFWHVAFPKPKTPLNSSE